MVLGLAACSTDTSDSNNSASKYQYTDFVMDTVLSETLYGGGEDEAKELQSVLKNLEEQELSWRVDTSEIAKMNTTFEDDKSFQMSEEMTEWMNMALQLAADSDGAFDPTIGKLTRLWNIEGDDPKVPSQNEIDACLAEVGYEALKVTDNTINIEETRSIDLGAAGKGIACDKAYETLEKNEDITGAVIAVGGSILTYGQKPDESSWNVAVQDPNAEDGTAMGVLNIEGTHYISTSGDYEKYFVEDGKKYHHILDPHTGYPAESGLSSVTIVCDNGLLSDALSTACFILGEEKSEALLEEYNAGAVLIDQDKNVKLLGNLTEVSFELLNDDYMLE